MSARNIVNQAQYEVQSQATVIFQQVGQPPIAPFRDYTLYNSSTQPAEVLLSIQYTTGDGTIGSSASYISFPDLNPSETPHTFALSLEDTNNNVSALFSSAQILQINPGDSSKVVIAPGTNFDLGTTGTVSVLVIPLQNSGVYCF